jgi:hypothetical protein
LEIALPGLALRDLVFVAFVARGFALTGLVFRAFVLAAGFVFRAFMLRGSLPFIFARFGFVTFDFLLLAMVRFPVGMSNG